jgi:hypothetical protein
MTNKRTKAKPNWSDIKSQLADWDRARLMDLLHDLYTANKDNQLFLHTRFAVGSDVLKPYKQTIARWIAPDVLSRQTISLKAANKAISDYRKAEGHPRGLAELMVFYCEEASGFSAAYGCDDEVYLDALVRTFAQALQIAAGLPTDQWNALLGRLAQIRTVSHDLGYGVGDAMDDLLAKHDLG